MESVASANGRFDNAIKGQREESPRQRRLRKPFVYVVTKHVTVHPVNSVVVRMPFKQVTNRHVRTARGVRVTCRVEIRDNPVLNDEIVTAPDQGMDEIGDSNTGRSFMVRIVND